MVKRAKSSCLKPKILFILRTVPIAGLKQEIILAYLHYFTLLDTPPIAKLRERYKLTKKVLYCKAGRFSGIMFRK